MAMGNKVSHANNRSRRSWMPNLQTVRAAVPGRSKQVKVCTRCLRSHRIQKAIVRTA
jgi:large subunit ribosomal protein L28